MAATEFVSQGPTDGEKYNLRRILEMPPPFSSKGTRFTPRRVQNLIQSNLERFAGRTELASRPARLTVEATNFCNLRCPACYTGLGEVGRPRRDLPLEAFRRLISELGPYLFEVEFYNWGEPLLAPALPDMIALAHAAGASTTVSTNLSFRFEESQAERLISSGVSSLGVSIDGASQAAYEKYRVGGNLARVLDNCRLLAAVKRRLGSESPTLIWEYHVFSHNVDEIEEARRMAREIGMVISVDKGFVLGPDWDSEGRYQFFLRPPPLPERCDFLWRHATVNNEGGVSPCPGSFYREHDLGRFDVSPEGEKGSFAEIWNGERLRAARALFDARGAPGAAREFICHDCPRTVLFEEWRRYLSSGAPPGTFHPTVTADISEWVNFFWSKRPTASPEERGLVPLRRKRAPTSAK